MGQRSTRQALRSERYPRPQGHRNTGQETGLVASISVGSAAREEVLLRTRDVRQVRREVLGKWKAPGMKSNRLSLSTEQRNSQVSSENAATRQPRHRTSALGRSPNEPNRKPGSGVLDWTRTWGTFPRKGGPAGQTSYHLLEMLFIPEPIPVMVSAHCPLSGLLGAFFPVLNYHPSGMRVGRGGRAFRLPRCPGESPPAVRSPWC